MANIPTETQVSSGGVAYRKNEDQVDVVLISVGRDGRWQLPKGMVDKGETREETAIREVREETGLDTELLEELDKIEYWYYGKEQGNRIRYHKFVYFYLLRYLSGNVEDHDFEVNEARWFKIEHAQEMLAFDNEKEIVKLAQASIAKIT